MPLPKVSIVIPTYNRVRKIKTPILSIIGQTYTDWELIIVDDHSNDETEMVVKKFFDS